MYKLEHGVSDQQRSKTAAPTISQIVEHQATHKDDYLLNQLARRQFRVCTHPLRFLLLFLVPLAA
jgi:hypothetical protein